MTDIQRVERIVFALWIGLLLLICLCSGFAALKGNYQAVAGGALYAALCCAVMLGLYRTR